MTEIPPDKIDIDVTTSRVNRSENPNNCYCGFYVYYSSICGHAFQEVPVFCGPRTMLS